VCRQDVVNGRQRFHRMRRHTLVHRHRRSHAYIEHSQKCIEYTCSVHLTSNFNALTSNALLDSGHHKKNRGLKPGVIIPELSCPRGLGKKSGSRLKTRGARRKPLRAPTQSFTAARLSPDGTSNCGGVLTGTQKSEVRISSRNRPASKVDSASTRARHPSKLWWRDCRAFVTMSATEACHRGREQGQLERCRYRGRRAAARVFSPDACGWGNDCFASVSPLFFSTSLTHRDHPCVMRTCTYQ